MNPKIYYRTLWFKIYAIVICLFFTFVLILMLQEHSWNLIWGIPSWLFLLWCFINVGYSKIIITENQVILKLLLIGKPKILNLEDVDYICKDGKFGFYYLGTNKPVKPKKIILNVKEMDELIVEIVKRASPIGVDLVIKNRIEKYQFQKQGMIKLQ